MLKGNFIGIDFLYELLGFDRLQEALIVYEREKTSLPFSLYISKNEIRIKLKFVQTEIRLSFVSKQNMAEFLLLSALFRHLLVSKTWPTSSSYQLCFVIC